jgi:hypothetical protein
MSALEPHYIALLEKNLESAFIPHLPPLLDVTKPADQNKRKNLSRALSAFVLHHTCGIGIVEAAKSIVDDFDDYGIDAIYYHAPSETLYLVQSKLKASEQFSQNEALAFCQGIRKLIRQELDAFNLNVTNRKTEIEDAIENCAHIKIVVAHTGAGISKHANDALIEIIADEGHGETRFETEILDYGSPAITVDLLSTNAYAKVDTSLWLQKCSEVSEPRITYFGLVPVKDLVDLHEKHGKALYEKNIRTFLGHKTDVNTSIQNTLATSPEKFLYLNNGVTALCNRIEVKGTSPAKGGRKQFRLRGFSVINGAQTIASSARFVADNKGADISAARVLITLIKADSDGDFGKAVTRARNHQNPVMLSNFAALDDDQERLRRELGLLGIHYLYKAGSTDGVGDSNSIRIDEAVQALAMLQHDPRYAVWLKKEPAQLFDTNSVQYKSLFGGSVTGFQLANAVRVNRYIQERVVTEAKGSSGLERLAYKHGNYALAWLLVKRLSAAINAPQLIDEVKLKTMLSTPFDLLRQSYWAKMQPKTVFKGPLSIMRNQTDALPLLQEVMISDFGLTLDPVIGHKRGQHKAGQLYPEDLFDYLISKAPQIGVN